MRQPKETAPISQDDCAFFDNFIVEYNQFFMHQLKKYNRPDMQDDIIQEARLRLMLKIPTLRELNHNKKCAYIAEAVRTAFIDLYRKEKRHSYVPLDNVIEEMVGIERDLVPDLFLRQELQRLRKHLSPREWLALKGKYIFGYSQEELGRQLDIAPDSVRMFLSRVRKQAKRILSPEKVTGGDGND